jgi:aminoglycoside/choline kinase family phosphotransferase
MNGESFEGDALAQRPRKRLMPAEIDQSLSSFVARAMTLIGESPDTLTFQPLAGDGSNRKVYRIRCGGFEAIAVSNPLPPERIHPDENEGFLAVRDYLQQRRVRVPALYAADIDRGYLLLEDLGDQRLYDLVRAKDEVIRPRAFHHSDLYENALHSLILMQQPGVPSFRPERVSNPSYTADFILDQESSYFHRELVRGMAGRIETFQLIESECRRIARTALASPHATPHATPHDFVFMHRDYQSRNLMVVGGALAVIDFQGARFGPAEYDLAALLYDPYVTMPESTRVELIHLYTREASGAGVAGIPNSLTGESWQIWERRMLANAANRLMQALGAFAKLGGRLQRPGFVEHIPQGLYNLGAVLTSLGDCPRLLALVEDLRSMSFPR